MKREKLEQLAHIIAGVIILIYGFEALEAGEFKAAASYLTVAIIFMIVAGAHVWLLKKFKQSDVTFFLLEAVTLFYLGWDYKNKGYSIVFYVMAGVAILYFIFSIITLLVEEKPRSKSSRKRRRREHTALVLKEERF